MSDDVERKTPDDVCKCGGRRFRGLEFRDGKPIHFWICFLCGTNTVVQSFTEEGKKTMSKNIYRQFDESHEVHMSGEFAMHMDRMTREGLHGKAEIALELAYRDFRIKELEAEVRRLKDKLKKLRRNTSKNSGLGWL